MLKFKKNKSSLCFSIIFCICFISYPETGIGATLKIATDAPDGSTWMRLMRSGAKKIKKRTVGRVKFKFYPGSIMGNDKSVLRKIRIRQLHGSAFTTASLAHIYPDIQIYGLPLLFRSLSEADYVRKYIDKILMKGLEKRGFVTFGLAEGGFAYLMSNNPVKSIDDLKAQKVWLPQGDKLSLTVFEVAGITPIPLSLADVMTGLQTGLINTVATPHFAAIALQWHTRVKYLTDTPLTYTAGLLAINRKAFMKLKPADRKIVRDVMGNVFRKMNKQNRLDNMNARTALQKQGIKFVKPTKQALQQWRQIALKARKKLGKQGEYTSVMLRRIEKLLIRFRKQQHR